MFDLTEVQWLTAVTCALLIGLTKTGIPGLGVLIVPLMAGVFPARASTGIVLPMLMFADVFAVVHYHRKAVWSHLLRIMPWTAIGIVIGFLALERINDQQLSPIISVIILAMLGVNFLWKWRDSSLPEQYWFAVGLGVLAGVTTMMANAAGPIMAIYLLAMRLPKDQFIGTGAWYYLALNWFKVPFSFSLGLLTAESLMFDLILFPVIAFGALFGIIVLKHIPEKTFSIVIQVLAVISSVNLLL